MDGPGTEPHCFGGLLRLFFSALVFELPKVIVTSQKQEISLRPRVIIKADVGSWKIGRPLAEPVGSNISSRLADSVCYSFPLTTDKDSLKGNLPWLFITEIMPLQSAIPKAKETRENTLIQLQGQVPGRGAVWSSQAPAGFKRASRNLSENKVANGLKTNSQGRPGRH